MVTLNRCHHAPRIHLAVGALRFFDNFENLIERIRGHDLHRVGDAQQVDRQDLKCRSDRYKVVNVDPAGTPPDLTDRGMGKRPAR